MATIVSPCVNFAGFRMSDTTIEPPPKYLDAIKDFPSPASTRHQKLVWPARHSQCAAINEAIRKGVEIFDLQKRICLRSDWSKRGVGYFLLQQHCSCPSGLPDCCPGGWRITLAGSRFLSSAENRYAAIEGEAIAWGLEQTRYFTQGCDSFIVVTDHKPLVKIFGNRTLDEISNSRLFRLTSDGSKFITYPVSPTQPLMRHRDTPHHQVQQMVAHLTRQPSQTKERRH